MSENGSNLDLPADEGPVGKPSQAEGDEGEAPEMTGPQDVGKPSQAEGGANA